MSAFLNSTPVSNELALAVQALHDKIARLTREVERLRQLQEAAIRKAVEDFCAYDTWIPAELHEKLFTRLKVALSNQEPSPQPEDQP